jgi:hypothetical protein
MRDKRCHSPLLVFRPIETGSSMVTAERGQRRMEQKVIRTQSSPIGKRQVSSCRCVSHASDATHTRTPPNCNHSALHQDDGLLRTPGCQLPCARVPLWQTELPLGKSALASFGHLSWKRTFLFLIVLRSEFLQTEQNSVVLDSALKGDGGAGKAGPGWSTPERRCWNRSLRTATVNVIE